MADREAARALRAAFAHTVFELFDLYDELGASDELRERTADVLAPVFRAHLRPRTSMEDGALLDTLLEKLSRELQDDEVEGELDGDFGDDPVAATLALLTNDIEDEEVDYRD